MHFLELAFWLALAFVAYVYAGYPALLALVARVRPRPVRKAPGAYPLPRVSIVVAVRNEEKRIAARLENLLSAHYPSSRRQIVVVSDGSTDGTAAAVRRFSPHVELLTQPALGKASALNRAVAAARGEVLVFADARQTFAADALLRLVRNFADPEVGAVSGELVLDAEAPVRDSCDSSIAEGVGMYWRYEKWLRRNESLVNSTVGVTGAIYAMRRSCWRPLPDVALLDDVLAPMRVVLQGKRVVFEPEAKAYDRVAPDAGVESRRKVRTLAGNFQLPFLEPRVLLPGVNPVWLQYVSHKLGRLLVPYALFTCLITSAALAPRSFTYAAALLVQLSGAALAAYGAILDRRERAASPAPAVAHAPTAAVFGEGQRTRTKRVVNA